MNYSKLTVSEAAQLLGVSTQTLRRWDTKRILQSQRPSKTGFRYYAEPLLETFVEDRSIDITKMARSWAHGNGTWRPLDRYYCASSNIFQWRLQSLEQRLATVEMLQSIFPLITAVVGEIGNNSFDHNIGNWPDMPGIFFGHDARRKKIILADRGQGILATLSRIRPTLQSHRDALTVAFTEILTARAPEHRGNGLKFVRKVVTENNMKLAYQTGDACLVLPSYDANLHISKCGTSIMGCFAVLSY